MTSVFVNHETETENETSCYFREMAEFCCGLPTLPENPEFNLGSSCLENELALLLDLEELLRFLVLDSALLESAPLEHALDSTLQACLDCLLCI